MGPTRHNTRSKAGGPDTNDAQASSLSSRPQASASSAVVGTSPRASPYTRTPTRQVALRASEQTTPVSRTGSPSMIKDIFQMISPFRAFSRASRSAAFGGEDEDTSSTAPVSRMYPSLDTLESAVQADGPDEMDVEEAPAQSSRRLAPPKARASRSASPRPRHSLPAPPKSLPLADNALLTPGIHKYGQFDEEPSYTTTRQAPATNTSPVSRNYDLLARFFSEKQRGGSSGLSEVEVGGCIRLIEESMAVGRDLQSEFQHPVTEPHYAPSVNDTSSRASSVMPSALPASQTMGNLFHPGTRTLPASSSAYSFLAPRPSSSASGAVAAAATRRRPIYLGPGMSSLSLNRRRTPAPSARTVASTGRGFLPRSATDPQLSHNVSKLVSEEQRQPGPEEVKRRRPNVAAPGGTSPDRSARFDSSFERRTDESSALAKEIAAHTSPQAAASSAAVSPLKRAAPSAAPVKTSPPKVPTRTASAIQDILKDSPLVRAPVKTELVNPYQSASSLTKTAAPESRPIRSARANMLTRAKAKEVANAKSHKAAAERAEPPKESILDLIERTAPRARATRKRNAEQDSNEQQPVAPKTSAPRPQAQQAQQDEPSVDTRKLQRTEEVQRRLEALTKAKNQNQSQAAPQQQKQQSSAPAPNVTPAAAPVTPQKAAAPAPAALSTGLVPPQYTASKPKKPSPLSVAFQAPESPGSETESAHGDARAFKPASVATAPAKPAPAPSSGFTFSLPQSSGAASSLPSSTKAPELAPSVGGFSFSASQPTPKPTTAVASSPSAVNGPFPVFDFAYSVTDDAHSDADRTLKAEIRAIAETTLPKFSFTYEVETTPGERKSDEPAASSSRMHESSTTSRDDASEDVGKDPSKVGSSGLLGEGEGEEAETTEFEVRAKFWKFDTEAKAYKDLGICVAKVKSNNDTHKKRLLARNEANGKVAVNFHIYKSIQVTRDKNVCSFLGFSEEGKPTQFRTKVKTDDMAQEFQEALSSAAT